MRHRGQIAAPSTVKVFTYRPRVILRGSLAVKAEHSAYPYRRPSITAMLTSQSFTAPLLEGEQLSLRSLALFHQGAFLCRHPQTFLCRPMH